MAYRTDTLARPDGSTLADPVAFRHGVERLLETQAPRFRRLWGYYRNPIRDCAAGLASSLGHGDSDRPYRQGQEWGLPARITGSRAGRELFAAQSVGRVGRKEVVIENDIGWRVETMVDYLFGKSLVIDSAAPDERRRALLGRLARAIIAESGGILFLQQLALLGAVYGFVDVLVKLDADAARRVRGISGMREVGEPPARRRSAAHDGAAISNSSDSPADVAVTSASLPSEGPSAASITDARQPAPDGASGVAATPASGSTPSASQAGPLAAAADALQTPADNAGELDDAAIGQLARLVRLEIVEPARALPLLSPHDWRVVDAYAQCYRAPHGHLRQAGSSRPSGDAPPHAPRNWWRRLMAGAQGVMHAGAPGGNDATIVELITPTQWQRYEDERLVATGVNSLGEIPLVHIQNTAVPFEYSGASDVEGLMPLQDELNTRLSDRANRISLQSFKMYLGKGIRDFGQMQVEPGRMWTADDENADVKEFGGDDNCPSESSHITDVREAMDKISGVSPIAAGAIKSRIGRLTSAAALRITLISLLGRTEKKRTNYGIGLQRMVELAFAWLDKAGLVATAPEERRIELHWPSPLPENLIEKLQEAEAKTRLGVPREVVLRELGY